MRINRWREIAVVCIVLMMAACAQQTQTPPKISATPTLASLDVEATDTPVPSVTPIVRATLPPTWTPALSYTPSVTLTPSTTLTPSMTLTPSLTITPSKTPSPTFTFTVTYTPSPNATDFALLSRPAAPECANFAPDTTKGNGQFKFGTGTTVTWIAADKAAVYIVRLFDANQATLLTDKTPNTSYTFSADQLAIYQPYSWTVAPLDKDGVQICPSRGGSLIAMP